MSDSVQFSSIQLTCGSRAGSRRLNGRTVPAFDSVQDTFFLLALGREARHAAVGYDRFAGAGVDDSWEDGAAVAASLAVNYGFVIGMIGGEGPYTAEMIPP